MSDIEMHYRFERYWEENASKDTWANKSVAFNIWQSQQAKIDELQARIDGALNQINGITRFINEDNPRDADALSVTVDCELSRIAHFLKGNKDEN